MSHAHYVRCEGAAHLADGPGAQAPPAITHLRRPVTRTDFAFCRACLDTILDLCDDNPDLEPLAIVWAYDAWTRWCPAHDWPAELCSDWTHRRRTLVERGLTLVDLVFDNGDVFRRPT